ncbi:MAG TPA: cell envelope integrity protein CreD [Telluria sp.]|nr:cell envelope integrity protein CreD [Telluria sp.]
MQKSLLFKIIIVFCLMIVIGIPLTLIQATIGGRMAFRDQAVASIAADSVGEQNVIGPVLVIPYKEEYETEAELAGDPPRKKVIVKHAENRRHLVFPNELRISGSIDTDRRYRGIHQVLVYAGQHSFAGDFDLPAIGDLPRAQPNARITPGRPYVALGVGDVRGIRNIPKINWDGKAFEFQQGTGMSAYKTGLHATLDLPDLSKPSNVKFSFDLGLDGIERLAFAPVGKNNRISLKSNWAHPQFGGRFLPSLKDRTINQLGFAATWNISSLATNAQEQITRLNAGNDAAPMHAIDQFNVGFIEPVNAYSMADRATKYGILFVALTFAAFFVFEILKRLPIHPVQYLLVGLALAVFFLLLVGLSEHIAFLTAYLIASAACILLIGFYLSSVLHEWRRGFAFGCALTLLYSALYGLLISENNALVLGSILLFAVLAAIMVATRKVDWYRIGRETEGAAAEA